MTPSDPRRSRPAETGFTLPEMLIASVLGAMLLTSLAVSTFGFTVNLDHLEAKANVGNGIDPVLRRMTRDIREAWWVEKLGPSHLRIAAPDGSLTEYSLSEGDLFLTRPNGDVGAIYHGLDALTLDTAETLRKREAPPVDHDGIWLSAGEVATPFALEVPAGGSLALGFSAPAVPADLPGGSAAEEQLLEVSSAVVRLPVAFIAGTGSKVFSAELYESWAPGRGKPTGSALASVSLPDDSIPAATQTAGLWNVPTQSVALSLPAALTPGVGYTLVLSATGGSQLLVAAGVAAPAPDADEVALKDSPSGSYVAQPMLVPYTIEGPYLVTATSEYQVVTRVSLTAYPTGQQPQHRSASILSQSYSLDPWLGVVPGETAP
ncbi:MAG TPA: prepilin-type N-terminal cleavage/methylation domain-containing protein [Planctomycetota bacterium]|nr:prepilin-type N-terminal cleavage/methylation domain-containing protein [Planctomycetota bacterium]